MSSFWTSFFEHLKDCGRNATLFIVTLAVLLGLLPLAGVLFDQDRLKNLLPAVPVVGLFALLWAGLAIRRLRVRRRERWQCLPLSGDELRVARSKLKRSRT
jgi:hypothetical protein